MRRWALPILLTLVVAGCNFKDPVGETYPYGDDENNGEGSCETNADCNDNGACTDDVCVCDVGYTSDDCDDCDNGFVQQVVDGETVCVPEGGCDEGEVFSPENPAICVDDLCAEDPCTQIGQVAGSCVMDSDTTYTCDCQEGFEGELCEEGGACTDDTCDNGGTCVEADGGFTCECPDRYAGETCGECEAPFDGPAGGCMDCLTGTFGDGCELGCDANARDQGWWNGSWNERVAVFVQAPENEPSPNHTIIQATFDHAEAVTRGSLPGGNDVRIVWVDPMSGINQEVPRVLGVDSAWNSPNTAIWWKSQRDIPAGEYDLYYIYYLNAQPGPPPGQIADVLRPARGWAVDDATMQSLYAPISLGGRPSTVQVRQIGLSRFEVHYADESDFDNDALTVTITELPSNMVLQTFNFSDRGGSPGSPAVETRFFDSTAEGLAIAVRGDTMTGYKAYYGAVERSYNAGSGMGETRRFSRVAMPLGKPPSVVETCGAQQRMQ